MNEQEWAPIRTAVNDYALYVADASLHESASKADIAHASALSALQKVRRAIETATAASACADAAIPLTHLKRLEHGGYKECRPENRKSFPVFIAPTPVAVTAEMIEAVRLHLEIRAGEDAPINIEEMLSAALKASDARGETQAGKGES